MVVLAFELASHVVQYWMCTGVRSDLVLAIARVRTRPGPAPRIGRESTVFPTRISKYLSKDLYLQGQRHTGSIYPKRETPLRDNNPSRFHMKKWANLRKGKFHARGKKPEFAPKAASQHTHGARSSLTQRPRTRTYTYRYGTKASAAGWSWGVPTRATDRNSKK